MAKPAYKPNPTPTHLPLVFTSRTFMRRAHIQGSPQAKEGENPLMMLCNKGEKYDVDYSEALQLIVAETGIQANKVDNAEWIAHVREEAKEEAAREAKISKEAPKPESLDEKIARIVAQALAPLLGKKAA